MVTEQDTLIYIENQDKHDASVAANAFAHKDTKNRAYINTLGAELALKYLAAENIDISNIHNIHSIKKILEEIDISDIMLPNIHIDVRVVFDENVIFIPKSHFEYNLVPDIYLVLNLAKDFSHVKFLGFFEPKLINKNNANDKYYFIEKEKLNSVKDLKHYIESFKGSTSEKLSDEELTNSERIIIAMADNDISENDKKYLIQQLTKSAELRDRFLEYENFETLSYKAMTDPKIDRKNMEEKLSANEIENLTETNTQEAISNLEDIENLTSEQSVESHKEFNNANTDNIISDIAETAIEGAAAIAGAQAADEIFNTIDKSVDLAETALDFTDLPDGDSELSANTSNIEDNESISFENIDTTELDNIETSEETFQEDPISLNDVEIPENTVQTDYIDSIDNKISFNDVPDIEKSLEEPAPLNLNEEKISLDNINISDVTPLNSEENFSDETISLDNIDISNNIPEIVSSNIDTVDNVISFDNIQQENISQDKEENYQEETISFESFDNEKESKEEANTDKIINENEEMDDFLDDTLTLDNIEEETNLPENNNLEEQPDTTDLTENLENNTGINEEITPDNIISTTETNSEPLNQEPEIVEDTLPAEDIPSTNNEGFGKNLLENLSSENLDDISIENLNLDNTEITQKNAENISSNDLLSQVDDILTSSDKSYAIAENTQDENGLEESNENISSEDFDSIPEISELTDTPELEDDMPSISGNLDSAENTDDTSIDELLNNDDDNQPVDSENDNIGVLFNDTDPVTDAELDNMEEFNSEEQEPIDENQMQNIPGAALYNKKSRNNKGAILITTALITIIAAASAVMILKPKDDTIGDIEPITSQNTGAEVNESPLSESASTEPTSAESNTLATNVPDLNNNNVKETIATNQTTKELKNTALKPKQNKTSAYMDVNKLVWDVPNTLSYNPKMQNYFRTAGKSIKLSLSADLLLANEYAYTNQVKVSLKLSKDGNILDSKIVSSSGSTQIDNIVLQSVKNTLSVVKPPSSEIKTPDFNLSLIIYF